MPTAGKYNFTGKGRFTRWVVDSPFQNAKLSNISAQTRKLRKARLPPFICFGDVIKVLFLSKKRIKKYLQQIKN
jgi:hypothetical protein